MKEKLLIQTNQHFTKNSWEKSFKEYSSEIGAKFDIEFVSDQSKLAYLIPMSKYCFLFQLPEINLINNLQLLYLGISDIDFFDSYIFPDNANIYSSKGLASNLIAEHALLLALSLIRKLPVAVLNQSKKKWDQRSYIDHGVRSIKDYKIGVLGLGNNGRAVVEIFKDLGCWVAGYSNNAEEDSNLDSWYSKEKLEDMLTVCDIIVISVPLRNETFHLIDSMQFESMGKNTFLINIARGEIINENALYLALKNNLIKGAAIDVFEKEPLSKKSKLWKLPNVIITPHIAGNINFLIDQIQLDFISKVKEDA